MLEQLKRKKRILYGLCGFISFMLICTFVSRAIYADSLAFVDTRRPEPMPLQHVVSAPGSVSQGQETALWVPSGLRIQEVPIREGDRIEAGGHILTVDKDGLDEFVREQEIVLIDLEQLSKSGASKSAKRQLNLRKEQLEKYLRLQENDGKVTAEQGGVITRVNVTAGGVTSQTAAFVMTVPDGPLLFEALLDKEQKQYVSKGDRVRVKLGNDNAIEAKVDYLTETAQADGGYEAAIMLDAGAGELGQSGTLEAVFQTERFPCCIPIEALHEGENQRNFVYVLVEKEGFLGTELSARKLFVTVLDKNEAYAAVEPGVLDADCQVITYATKEIEDGTVVRRR